MSAYIINGCGRQIRTEPLGYEPKMLPITLPRYIRYSNTFQIYWNILMYLIIQIHIVERSVPYGTGAIYLI